jgi:putative ABC transport system permease protein
VFTDGARVVGKNNKVVLGTGGPRYGANWLGEDELLSLREGSRPDADGEIVLSANLARKTGYKVGDSVGVLAPKLQRPQQFTVAGIAGYSGGRDSLAGETIVFFTEATAQQLMLGETGVYNSIDVKIAGGADLTEVRNRIAAALGDDYEIRTGEELAADSAEGVKVLFNFFTYILLGFAGIALFVGGFLILNTFSIIVAQRTRELALFRAMGASRNQVIGSVLVEALVVGVTGSVIGLAVGIGIGLLLGNLMGSALSDGALELAGLAVPLAAVIAAFAVGVGITVLSALLPAVRAARIAPVEAMRESATPDRPLTRLTVAGAAVLAAGGTALGLGLTGNLGDTTGNLWGVLGGVLTCFVGIALLTPIASRPVVSAIGRLFGQRASGKLGRRNSARNPRRTAITAAALMVSIAIVTGISVIFASIRESTVTAVDTTIDAELVVAAEGFAGGLGSFDPAALDRIRELSGVDAAAGVYADLIMLNNEINFATGADDLAAAQRMFAMEPVSGRLAPLGPDSVIVDQRTATDLGLATGGTITVQMARTPPKIYTVQGIYTGSTVNAGFYFPVEDITAGFNAPTPVQAFVKLRPGADVDAVYSQVEALLRDSPEVSVSRLDDYIAQQVQVFDIVLIMVQVLLLLAMIIAVLGIINTMALSITERTRELGLLRAVGMKRGQVMWMVSVESVVISVFGALLGVVVGVGLGVAVFQALRDQGFTDLAFPWPLMAGYVIASVFVGLVAALLPAIRAAQLDVLKAIAYE